MSPLFKLRGCFVSSRSSEYFRRQKPCDEAAAAVFPAQALFKRQPVQDKHTVNSHICYFLCLGPAVTLSLTSKCPWYPVLKPKSPIQPRCWLVRGLAEAQSACQWLRRLHKIHMHGPNPASVTTHAHCCKLSFSVLWTNSALYTQSQRELLSNVKEAVEGKITARVRRLDRAGLKGSVQIEG